MKPSNFCFFFLLQILLVSFVSACTSPTPAKDVEIDTLRQRYAERYTKGRTREEIESGFEVHKGQLAEIYLEHKNPTPGTVDVSLKIQSDGTVSECGIVFSSFQDPAFEDLLIEEIKKINFGGRDVPEFKVQAKRIVFAPFEPGR